MNVHERIQGLMKTRGWSCYRLAKEAGLSISTISNMLERNTLPTLSTLETICDAFGITLKEFFSTEHDPALTEEQEMLFAKWSTLTDEQKKVLLHLMDIL